MLLTKTKLVSTAYRPGQYDPQPLYEVAVVGRSNAGKSSLIDTICNNKKLARVSSRRVRRGPSIFTRWMGR